MTERSSHGGEATARALAPWCGTITWLEYFWRQWCAPDKRGMALRYTLRERFMCAVRMANAARLIHNGPPYK